MCVFLYTTLPRWVWCQSMASTPLPLAFFLFTIFMNLNLNGFANAQPAFLFHFCINQTGFFPNNSVYQRNLNTVLSSLSPNTDSNGFYNASDGHGSDQVYALALCRGDVNLDICRICINESVLKLKQICPNNKEAIGWYDYCMLRYSNKAMFGIRSDNPSFYMWNTQDASGPEQFNEAFRTRLDSLRREASDGDARRKFATANGSFMTAMGFKMMMYAMVQCTPDLSVDDCSGCLISVMEQIRQCCVGKIGGRVVRSSCSFRFEQYLFFNTTTTAPPPPAGNKGKKITIIIAVVASTIGSLLLLIFVSIFLTRRKQSGQNFESEEVDEIMVAESLLYDFGLIRDATDDFSDMNKLGEGGFGVVYKGKLSNGEEIAVKRLSKNSGQGELEFKNEVTLMAKLQHRNLVRLLGFYSDDSERLLIYEFMPNSSLDNFIFDPLKSSYLDWESRFKIIGGIARGLLYLHEDSRLRIVHRDLKASNILLDEDMNSKIADFGMARLFVADETHGSTSRIVGTYGYMAPEYITQGHFSVKSDVFSFGVLVLEIISGQKRNCFRIGPDMEDLLSYTWKNWRDKTVSNVIDSNLRNNPQSLLEIMRCVHIGLLCVQEKVARRPTMASVVLMLNSFSLTLSVPFEPAFLMHSSIDPEMALEPAFFMHNSIAPELEPLLQQDGSTASSKSHT